MSKTITFVTGNANKLREVSQVLADNKTLKFVNVDIDLPEFQGTAEDVSKFKCIEATKHIKGPVIVEDTSLSFNALNGMPGPYIKWFPDLKIILLLHNVRLLTKKMRKAKLNYLS